MALAVALAVGCTNPATVTVSVALPDGTSRQDVVTLSYWALYSRQHGCAELMIGAVSPADLTVRSRIDTTPAAFHATLETASTRDTLVLVEARGTQPGALLRGCQRVRAQAANPAAALVLGWICRPSSTGAEILENKVDDDCDGFVDEECHQDADCWSNRQACRVSSCEESTRRCVWEFTAGAPCDDGLFCNGSDSCDAQGLCAVHAGQPCVGDWCNESTDRCESSLGAIPPPAPVAVAASAFASCALTAGGEVICTGNKIGGRVHNIADLSPGSSHWGRRDFGRLGRTFGSGVHGGISTEQRAARVSAGYWHSCLLQDDGAAICSGENLYGQLGNGASGLGSFSAQRVLLPEQAVPKDLATGGPHSCALTVQGDAYCWGYNAHGQLGNGTTDDRSHPTAVDLSGVSGTLVQLVVGGQHTCGLTRAGQAYCWGRSDYGQAGQELRLGQPLKVASAVDLSQLAGDVLVELVAGYVHTCGRSALGRIYCWGSNVRGQLGTKVTRSSHRPVPLDTSEVPSPAAFSEISSGLDHTCARTPAGGVYCWGEDTFDQLGDKGAGAASRYRSMRPLPGAYTARATVLDLSDLPRQRALAELALGGSSSCGLAPHGAIYCWGDNAHGQLGDGTRELAARPSRAVSAERAFAALGAGERHACGLTGDGQAFCWGRGQEGQLGNGSEDDALKPVALSLGPEDGPLVTIAGGGAHTCALTGVGRVLCWGDNAAGQTGASPSTPRLTRPAPVAEPSGTNEAFLALALGGEHSCGLSARGAAHCWGRGSEGQLGNGQRASSHVPVPVSSAHVEAAAFVAITAGRRHACGLTPTGRAYCWGDDGLGQLGNGSGGGSASPSLVETQHLGERGRFVALAAGGEHTCALSATGQVSCWGRGDSGQLGNGALTGSQLPVEARPPDRGGFVAIQAGGAHTCAIATDGVTYCWGDNVGSQPGVPVRVDLTALQYGPDASR